MFGCVDDHTDSANIPLAGSDEVIGRRQSKSVEGVKCRGGWRAEPAWLADVRYQSDKLKVVVNLEAALVPASKLWGELTIDDRRSAVLSGHAAESIIATSPRQPRGFVRAFRDAESLNAHTEIATERDVKCGELDRVSVRAFRDAEPLNAHTETEVGQNWGGSTTACPLALTSA